MGAKWEEAWMVERVEAGTGGHVKNFGLDPQSSGRPLKLENNVIFIVLQ